MRRLGQPAGVRGAHGVEEVGQPAGVLEVGGGAGVVPDIVAQGSPGGGDVDGRGGQAGELMVTTAGFIRAWTPTAVRTPAAVVAAAISAVSAVSTPSGVVA